MNQNSSRSKLRWGDYVLGEDESRQSVESVWTAPGSGSALYVLGEGFDPRTLVGLRRFLECRGGSATTVLSLSMPPAGGKPMEDLAAANVASLLELCTEKKALLKQQAYPEVSEVRAAGQKIALQAIKAGEFTGFDLIIIGVSAMPTAVHFALLSAVLQYMPQQEAVVNVQVVVCENPDHDNAIKNVGTALADTVGGFINDLDLENRSRQITIWAPVLGSGDKVALELVHQRLEPREICPVLPFPSIDPRLGDNLVLEYRQLLFEEMGVEPRNIIYAHERNPFDLYRTLSRLNGRYRDALEAPLGTVKVVVSSHTTKLMSLGVLLAAHEHKLPVVSVPPSGYSLAAGHDFSSNAHKNHLVCLWLDGSPYR